MSVRSQSSNGTVLQRQMRFSPIIVRQAGQVQSKSQMQAAISTTTCSVDKNKMTRVIAAPDFMNDMETLGNWLRHLHELNANYIAAHSQLYAWIQDRQNASKPIVGVWQCIQPYAMRASASAMGTANSLIVARQYVSRIHAAQRPFFPLAPTTSTKPSSQ